MSQTTRSINRAFNPALIVALFIFLPLINVVHVPAQQSSKSLSIEFTVAMPKPFTHLLEVEMRITATGQAQRLPAPLDLLMPVWTPGSYLVREYARNVQDFAAKDASTGQMLKWHKTNKNRWRIDAGATGANGIRVTYRVYANEFSVRTNELNDTHAFWNNAATLMYPDGYLKSPAKLKIVIPPGQPAWRIATGLPLVDGSKDTFAAENFDVLYDSPFEVGKFKELSFTVRGIPHRIVINGQGNYDPQRLQQGIQKIVETESAMFGELAYRNYTFILNLRATGGGGLEHLNSCALIFPRFGFINDDGYRNFFSLVAHEFFHNWNVKRIRPVPLGPFDYSAENYTKLLWVAEGITSYYEDLILVRAGLMQEKDYLSALARAIQSLQETPGRKVMSVEEASFDAWIKFYRPDENAVNSQVSYYSKGSLLGLLLDIEIRRRTNGMKSLDDVMRYLYHEFFKKNRNYTSEDFESACQAVAGPVAGSSFDDFFQGYVRGREELEFNAAFKFLGLRIELTPVKQEKGYLGAILTPRGGQVTVQSVVEGTPAFEQGLNADDQIIAINRARVIDVTSFQALIDSMKPEEMIELEVFRQDELRSINIKLGRQTTGPLQIVPIERPSAEQQKLYKSWLGRVQ
ncbi:MAG: M61 family metallopeptidase [Pyrinomonadaceae bacterium]